MNSNRLNAKDTGKKNIRGLVIPLFLTCLLMGLPEAILSGAERTINHFANFNSSVTYVISVAFSVASVALYIFMIPIEMGLYAKFLHVARGGTSSEVSVFDFYRRKEVWEPIKATLIASIYIIIGLILFVIPGIILAIKYSMLNFVFADNPGISYRDALVKCGDLTKGKKWEIFVFWLSFLGWFLLVAITFGIASIYVIPYCETSFAALYDIYCPKKTPEPENHDPYSDLGYGYLFDFDKNEDGSIKY